MKLWKNSTMETYYASGDASDTDHCIVAIGEGRISVTYDYDGGTEVYEGPEIGSGHFKLKARDGLGEASLHCFPDGRLLDGWWVEEGETGMWRIRLAD
jgi:hypothetical protein